MKKKTAAVLNIRLGCARCGDTLNRWRSSPPWLGATISLIRGLSVILNLRLCDGPATKPVCHLNGVQNTQKTEHSSWIYFDKIEKGNDRSVLCMHSRRQKMNEWKHTKSTTCAMHSADSLRILPGISGLAEDDWRLLALCWSHGGHVISNLLLWRRQDSATTAATPSILLVPSQLLIQT